MRTDGATGEYELERPFSSLLSTTREVLFSPRRFFDGLEPDGPLGSPVAVAWTPLAGIPPVFYCLNLHATGLKRVHDISTGKALGATLMLTALLLVLATALAVYDYGLIREAMR